MQEDTQKKILDAFQLVFRPVVKILIRYGIGYNEIAETMKTAFVDVATAEFGIRGRPTNISRVAVMSGLTRKEVRRVRTKLESGTNPVKVKTTPIAEILTRWHSENDFLDNQGRPATLPYDGEPKSFSELVKRFGGDVPPGAMRTELKRMGLVDEDSDRSLSVVSRLTYSTDDTEKLVTGLVHGVYPLMSTIDINCSRNEKLGDGFAQFSTFSLGIDSSDKNRLRRISYDRLAEAAVSFDDLFAAYESVVEPKTDAKKKPVVMVGLYYFEETDKRAIHEW